MMNHHGSYCTYCSLGTGALLCAPHRSSRQVQPVQTMGSGNTTSKHTAVLLSSVCKFIWQLILVLNSDRAQGSNLRAGWSLSEDRSELPAELQCCSNSHADYKTYTPLGLSAEPSHAQDPGNTAVDRNSNFTKVLICFPLLYPKLRRDSQAGHCWMLLFYMCSDIAVLA